ncbi:tyrosine-type recombinase/integrase [Cupriavidus basilensis]
MEQRKTRSQLVLPLSDTVSQALHDYLHEARPRSELPHLFLRACRPDGPVSASEVGTIFASRVKRSGLPINATAPYCLRHSFAMQLLGLLRGTGIALALLMAALLDSRGDRRSGDRKATGVDVLQAGNELPNQLVHDLEGALHGPRVPGLMTMDRDALGGGLGVGLGEGAGVL